MAKKFQVVLPDWLEDYLVHLVNRYELNVSEVIRLQICFAILCMSEKIYPDLELDISPQDLSSMPGLKAEEIDREELLRTLSRIYFETRKAVEHRLKNEK